MTKLERLFLYNQYDILEKLDSDNGIDYKRYKDILLYGYESEYYIFTNFFSDVSTDICNEVINILNMFRTLYFSYKELENKEDIEEYKVTFQGFDGNEELEHYGFAKWYISDGNFQEFSGVDMNSHYNKLNYYRNMLSKYNQIMDTNPRPSKLNATQIKEIIQY